MGRCEHPHAGALEHCCHLRRLDRLFAKAPAGQTVGVAMDNPDAHTAHPGHQGHRQGHQSCRQFRMPARGGGQHAHDRVRARDIGVTDVIGITATATGSAVYGQKFGFDIAAYRVMRQHHAVDPLEARIVGVEPVEVAVEHQARARFAIDHAQQGIQRERIAIEAAGHIQRLGRKLRRPRQRLRAVAVRQGAGAPRALRRQSQHRTHRGAAARAPAAADCRIGNGTASPACCEGSGWSRASQARAPRPAARPVARQAVSR